MTPIAIMATAAGVRGEHDPTVVVEQDLAAPKEAIPAKTQASPGCGGHIRPRYPVSRLKRTGRFDTLVEAPEVLLFKRTAAIF